MRLSQARPGFVFAPPFVTTWLQAELQSSVLTKDLFLHLVAKYGDHANHNVEFGGPALCNLSMAARRTLSTMGTELNAEFSVFEPDEVLLDYVRERNAASFEPQYPDFDAQYASRRTLDLTQIEPLVACRMQSSAT